MSKCGWHLCNNKLSGKQKRWCSNSCKGKFYVTKNRRNNKRKLVQMFGGKCTRCQFDHIAALQFHHPDNNKEFGIAQNGKTRAFEKLVREAEKCILLCANCHAIEHYRDIPV